MVNNDIKKTQHYTTNVIYICQDLADYIPNNKILIEPFVGNKDMINLSPDGNWELYDIEDKGYNIVQDTLSSPPDYNNKFIITNPPFLAKNKATDKTLFIKYKYDDLYKIFLHTLVQGNVDGGIVILPTNFFTDEKSNDIRLEFLSLYTIQRLNIFTQPVFDSTTYSVCSFAFVKKENQEQKITTCIYPQNKKITINISKEFGYRLGGDELDEIKKQKSYFSRLKVGDTVNEYTTNIKLYCIDTRKEKIHASYEQELYYGIQTDRTYATLVCTKPLSKEIQLQLINNFNTSLNNLRDKYYDLCLTNYRDHNRKRIGFEFAYKLMSKKLDELNG